jgi:hypothetical protein
MIAVSSSNLKAVDYDGGDLLVAFRNGTLYRYFSVPYELFWRLLNAASKGRFLAQYIKSRFRYRRER